MTTCAFLPCDAVETCCLPGGCVNRRFTRPETIVPPSDLKKTARALNGAKPARTNRDPVWTPRKRKALR